MSEFKPIISRKAFDNMVDANFIREGDEVSFQIIEQDTWQRTCDNEKTSREVEERLNSKPIRTSSKKF